MTLRCRRCNVIRRPSHTQGGLTDLTAETALMWLLFTKQPSTYQEFKDLCRNYGLTMADIRFQEAWAMAKWLEREEKYCISDDSRY
ncbi:EcoNI [Planktothrix agardhii]|nr:EcoNI [Planktothrix agardhii]